MAGTFQYVRPDEAFALYGSVSGTTVDTTYNRNWLVDGRTSRPVRVTGTSASFTITGAATEVGLIAVGNHMFDAGQTIAVTGDVTATLTCPAVPPDGIRLNPVTVLGAPVSGVDSLTIGVTGAVSPIIIGEVMAGKVRELPSTLSRSTSFEEKDYAITRESEMAWIPAYDRGLASRTWRGTGLFTDTQLAELRAWWQAQRAGTRPSLIVPTPGVNDAWFVTFQGFRYTPKGQLFNVDLMFVEHPRSRF